MALKQQNKNIEEDLQQTFAIKLMANHINQFL
jgi:hypothetical protein